jgi:hypothetical protein
MVAALEQVEYVNTVGIPMRRVWAMPSKNTFDIPPIRALVRKYLYASTVSIDPFARNKRWATYTNDLNPDTAAEYHLEAGDFLVELKRLGIIADLFLFDPPYSPRQLKECYDGIGRKMQLEDGQTARIRSEWRDAAMPLLSNDAVVLSFGWNTVGFGLNLGFRLEEILIVCHGADHNDTICTVERKVESMQNNLFTGAGSGDNDVTSPQSEVLT